MKMAADWGAMPEKVSVKMRPMDFEGSVAIDTRLARLS